MTGVALIPVLLWVAALAFAGIAVWREGRPVLRAFVIDRLLRYFFLFPLGIQGLWAFVGHVFFAEQAAASIGWATSPFQYEVDVANLGLGLAAIYAAPCWCCSSSQAGSGSRNRRRRWRLRPSWKMPARQCPNIATL